MTKKSKVTLIILIFVCVALAGLIIFTKIPWSGSKVMSLPESSLLNEPTAEEDGSEAGAPEITEELKAEEAEPELAPEDLSLPEKSPERGESDEVPNITERLMDSGFQRASGRSIDTVIVHSSYDALGDDPFDVEGLVKEYEIYGVSAHYLIDREGNTFRLVEEKDIAYHAGAGKLPDGRTNVNQISLGIELMNTKDGQFTQAQYASLNALLGHIKNRYAIRYVLGHDQIAPGRKDDPWNFDWDRVK